MSEIRELALRCRDASRAVAALHTEDRDAMLRAMADALVADAPANRAAIALDLDAPR